MLIGRTLIRSFAVGILLISGTLTACSGDRAAEPSTGTAAAPVVAVDPDLAAQLPDRVKESGRLLVGTSTPFEPFIAGAPDNLTGFDVDVITAVAEVLGVKPVLQNTDFPQILPGVRDGTYDLGMRGIYDTLSREKLVDMVTYFRGGSQWGKRAGADVDPDDACGRRVGVARGTVAADVEIPAKNAACTTVGDPAITSIAFDNTDLAAAALTRGDIDALSADAAVTATAVRNSGGRLELAGHVFDSQPYGLPVAKGSALGPTLQKAIQSLVDSGALAEIARRWGLHSGLIATSTINGATQ